MDKLNKIKSILSELETDANKFYEKGNGAAGVRIRKAMLDIKALAQEVRAEVSEIKNKG